MSENTLVFIFFKIITFLIFENLKRMFSFKFAMLYICRIDKIICITRTKTSIRYAKENDREKRERRKERERKVKGEI